MITFMKPNVFVLAAFCLMIVTTESATYLTARVGT